MKLSLVLPAYNESGILRDVFDELRDHVRRLPPDEVEYVLVNDGSSDTTLDVMRAFQATSGEGEEVRILDLARNFGHQAAVTAGIQEATGDAIVLMDTDGQDDPVALKRFLETWVEGNEVVYAVRNTREEPGWLKFLFRSYYRLFSRVSRVPVPIDAGNFGLIDRRVADHIRSLPEHHRYFPGLRAWVGFRQTGIEVPRRARLDGRAKIGITGLFRLALDAIVSFSDFPLRLAFVFALGLSFLAALGIAVIVGIKLFGGDTAVPMWASIMTTVIFIGSVQFFMIGLLGEYVGRIYSEVKRRPHYIIRDIL